VKILQLYDKIIDLDRLEMTLLELCYEGSGVSKKEFENINLEQMQAELVTGTFKFSAPKYLSNEKRKYSSFGLPERLITKMLFSDLADILEPIFINNLFSHRKNKSYKHAIINLQASMQKNLTGSILRMDIAKYYDSIDHKILLSMLEKYVDEKTINLLQNMLACFGVNGKGIFSGSSLSNLFGNLYLATFDRLITENFANSTYLRFVDDMAVVCKDMKEAKELKEIAELYLDEKLKLKLSPVKSFLREVNEGCVFLGYNIFPNELFLLENYVAAANEELDSILLGKSRLTNEQIKTKVKNVKARLKNTCETTLQAKVEKIYQILKMGGDFSKLQQQPPINAITTEKKPILEQQSLQSSSLNACCDYELPTNLQNYRIEMQIATEIQSLNILHLTPWEAFLCVKKWHENILRRELT
jgi:hypothetical protein